jgi:hypothetical protein
MRCHARVRAQGAQVYLKEARVRVAGFDVIVQTNELVFPLV